jgi:hypothetical protein
MAITRKEIDMIFRVCRPLRQAFVDLQTVLTAVAAQKAEMEEVDRDSDAYRMEAHRAASSTMQPRIRPASQWMLLPRKPVPSTPQPAKESTMPDEIEDELTAEQKEAAAKKEFMLGHVPYALISEARGRLGMDRPQPWDKVGDSTRKIWREAARLANMESMGIWLNAHDPDAVAAYWEYTELIGERYEKTSEQYKTARQTYENMKAALADSQQSQKRG